jgi:AraC family transcriptional regulator
MISNLVSPIELKQCLVFSSQQRGWNGILVQQYQSSSTLTEVEIPALSNHWLQLPLGHPVRLIQKRDDRLHDSIVQNGDSIFAPSGQPSYWHCWERFTYKSMLHIYL